MSIRSWIPVFILCTLVTVLAAGCLGEKAPAPEGTAAPGVVLNYHRTGGIAGVDDRLVIFDNGFAVLSTKTSSHDFQVSKAELARILRLFEDANFNSLEGNFTSRHTGADFLQYRITYFEKTIITEDSVIPDSLQPIITELNMIISAGRSPDSLPGLPAGLAS